MEPEQAGSLSPEQERELEALVLKMRQHEAEMKAVIERHNLAWKRLESEPSPDTAEELLQAEQAMASAAADMEPISAAIDEVLVAFPFIGT